jgi:hypothetical protein
MHNVYLLQPQYSVDYRKEKNYWLPYSAACVWSYCQQFDDIRQFFSLADIIFKRENQEDLLDRLDNPKICGFSCYQWNRNYNLSLAKKIKNRWPNCTIVFGGPEVTVDYQLEDFIDVVVLGEGELAWLDILRKINQDQTPSKVYQKQRLEINDYPSPYVLGLFDPLVKANPGVKWATTLETNRGCPFSCTFCDWGSVTYSKVKKFNLERVAQDIDWIANNPISYIFCADANFGILKDRDLEIAHMVADAGRRSQNLEVFNATFNKNNNEWSFEILKVLGDLNKGFTVSVQSLYQPTLKAIKRDNLGINDLRHIFDLCNKNNISSYSELILGLPHETKDSFIDGICELLELGQHSQIEVWFTDLLTNSELASPMDRFNYGIKSIKTANYLALLDQGQDELYPEEVELVCATKSMNTEEMIDSYVYAWMIVNFHLQGYSQLTSRLCRQQHNITFRQFYDTLLSNIVQDTEVGAVYLRMKNSITNLLKNGQLDPGQSGHNLLFNLADELYRVKNNIFDLVTKTYTELMGHVNDSIDQAQRLMVVDLSTEYPVQIKIEFDLTTFDQVTRNYSVDRKTEIIDQKSFTEQFYALRRKGLLKTVATLLDK